MSTAENSLQVRVSLLRQRMSPHVVSRAIDILFFSLAMLCFGLFTRNSFVGADMGRGTPIAKLSQGTLERKRSGMLVFQEVKPGGDLFHHDAIWVGEGKSAKVQFDTGARMSIAEKTFLVLYRQLGSEDQIEVLSGSVEIETPSDQAEKTPVILDHAVQPKMDSSDAKAPNEKPQSGPSASPSPQNREAGYLRPKPGTVYYLVQKHPEIEITFAWTDKIEGVLVVTQAGGKEYARREVGPETFVRIPLKSGQNYEWQLFDREKRSKLGPIAFRIAPYDPKALGDALIGGAADHPIEIVN